MLPGPPSPWPRATAPTVIRELEALARSKRKAVDRSDAAHPRVWLHRRDDFLPTREWFYTVAPAVVRDDKVGPGFDKAWAAVAAGPAQLDLFAGAST